MSRDNKSGHANCSYCGLELSLGMCFLFTTKSIYTRCTLLVVLFPIEIYWFRCIEWWGMWRDEWMDMFGFVRQFQSKASVRDWCGRSTRHKKHFFSWGRSTMVWPWTNWQQGGTTEIWLWDCLSFPESTERFLLCMRSMTKIYVSSFIGDNGEFKGEHIHEFCEEMQVWIFSCPDFKVKNNV